MECSIVIPVYNEEDILEDAVERLLSVMEAAGCGHEILLCENGSRDSTPSILQRFAESHPCIRVISLKEANYGRAMRCGIEQARYEVVIILNIDFIDGDFIGRSLGLIDQYDIVVGSRNLPSSKDNRPYIRRVLTGGLNLILRWGFDYPGTETHWVKALRRGRVLPIIEKCRLERGVFDTELMIRAHRDGLSIQEIPVMTEEIRSPRNRLAQKIGRVVVDLIRLRRILNSRDGG